MKTEKIDVRSIATHRKSRLTVAACFRRLPLKFQVIAVFALSVLCATAWPDNNRVIHLISTCTGINNFVDVGPTGPSTGDMYVWVDEEFTPDGSKKVGEAFGWCNLIDPKKGSFGCTIVGVFNDGSTLAEEGILYNVPGVVSVGAIIGDTGQYRGATGQFRV